MGGRGRGGGGSKVEMAGALGIQRHQMASLQVNRSAAQSDFPVRFLRARVTLKDLTNELSTSTTLISNVSLAPNAHLTPFTAEHLYAMQSDIRGRFHDSPAYIDDPSLVKRTDDGIARYSDKYKKSTKPSLDSLVNWADFPMELRPRSQRPVADLLARPTAAKKRKAEAAVTIVMNVADTADAAELDGVAQQRLRSGSSESPTKAKTSGEEESDDRDEDGEEVVDEEDLEEENDYVEQYFDNGEDYDDGGGSGDNLDDDATY